MKKIVFGILGTVVIALVVGGVLAVFVSDEEGAAPTQSARPAPVQQTGEQETAAPKEAMGEERRSVPAGGGGQMGKAGSAAPAEHHPADAAADEDMVIETEVDGPEDCTPLETYDAVRRVCYITCSGDADCAAKEEQLDKALEAMDFAPADGGGAAENHFEDDAEISALVANALAVYRIEPGEKYVLTRGKETPAARKIKDLVARIVPTAIADDHIDRLVLMHHPDKDGLAFVLPDREGDNAYWTIFVNMDADSGGDELIWTLVHEFGHILFLNDYALDRKERCDGYSVDEGCASADTYLGAFFNAFWRDRFDPDAGADANYEPDAFVTEYAASDPVEDLAESFAAFVLKPLPQRATALRERKVLFFTRYSELRALRQEIRTALHKPAQQ